MQQSPERTEEEVQLQGREKLKQIALDCIKYGIYDYGKGYSEPVSEFRIQLGSYWRNKHLSQLLQDEIYLRQCSNREDYIVNQYDLKYIVWPEEFHEIQKWERFWEYHDKRAELIAPILWKIMTRQNGRKNTLKLYGGNGTGKSTVIKLLAQPWNAQILSTLQGAEHGNFMFQDCAGKAVAIMEEPFWSVFLAQECKKIMGGDLMVTDVKNGGQITIPPIPVLISTNNDVPGGHDITGPDKLALASRCERIVLNKKWNPSAILCGYENRDLTSRGLYMWMYKYVIEMPE